MRSPQDRPTTRPTGQLGHFRPTHTPAGRSDSEGMKPRIPKYSPTLPPQAHDAAIDEIAKMLPNAEDLLDHCRARGPHLGRLEVHGGNGEQLLQAGVVDNLQRTQFPFSHPLRQGNRAIRRKPTRYFFGEDPLLRQRLERKSQGRRTRRFQGEARAKVISISSLDSLSRTATTRISAVIRSCRSLRRGGTSIDASRRSS